MIDKRRTRRVKDGHPAAGHPSPLIKDYCAPAGTTLTLLNGEPLISFVLTTV
jgi:hypothetical protein